MISIKSLMMRLSCILAAVFLFSSVQAQQFPISGEDVVSCAGVLEDTGGPNGSYSDNENQTITICPDTPGDVISLQWIVWNLSTAGPNNNLDRIRVWDGDSNGATFLGEYTGNDNLSMLVIQATTFNTTGCLTLQFISNGVGTGDFAAAISCTTPCDRPVAVATMSEAVPALVCTGEDVLFDGSASYAAPGFNVVSYVWTFDDGTTSNDPIVSHSYAIPGEYVVQLTLTDDNDCVNTNVVDLQVLVSTTPQFSGTMENIESCVGSTVNLMAEVTPTTWTGIPESNLGGQLDLPDDVGIPFSNELVFTQFEPGQTLEDVDDFLSVCVSMEHSFMGDLVLSLTCPNGQAVIMHQQNGGGTFIGDANDTDGAGVIVPGTCWDYCWSPTATLGTWANCAEFGTTPNTMPSSQGNALVPDTYSSVQPFSQLLGCPLNGSWTFTSTDLWAADNGTICSWSINFDPSIIPEATQFTPVIGGSTLDSAGWSGPNLLIDPAQPLNAQAVVTQPGDYPYSFFVMDNFGCSYDTTIVINVPETAVVEAGQPITLCFDPMPMTGEILANGPPANCVFTLSLYDSAWDGWNGGASLDVTIGGTMTNYTLANGNQQDITLNVSTGDPIQFSFTEGTVWNNENSFTLFDDTGAEVFASPNGPPTGVVWNGVISCGGGTPFSFEWSPATGLNDPTDPGTDVFVSEPTLFFLSTYPVGHPECAVTDSVLVQPGPPINAGESNVITICANNVPIMMLDSLIGTPDAGGVWKNSAGAVVASGAFDPTVDTDDIFTYTVTSTAGCQLTATLGVTVIPSEDPTCCGIVDAGEAAFSCNLTIELSASRGNTGVGNWEGPPGAMFYDAYDAITNVTMPIGSGGTHKFYWVEDDGAFCHLIDSVEMTFTDDYEFEPTLTDAICFSYCDGTASMVVTGGNPESDWDYVWSNGDAGTGMSAVDGLCAGDHTLTVRDENGCEDTFAFVIGEPVLLRVDSMSTKSVTCSGDCDGEVTIYDGEAIEYSFDNGDTWVPDSVRTAVCEGITQVKIKNVAGCIGTDAIAVTGPPPVIADFTWTPRPADVEHAQVTFVNTSSGSNHWDWNIADLMTTTVMGPVFSFNEKIPGTYPVCLIAYNYNECSDTICYTVAVNDVLYTYIPNSFTPDGDNVNDTWWPSANIPVHKDFELMVFDRWGQMVFNTEDPYMAWHGSYQNGGDVLNTGVYAYRLLYGIQESDVRKEIVGYVTLMK